MAVSPGFTDELICSICLETFNTPILLPCAHTFCKQCLINVHERGQIRRQSSIQSNAQNRDGGSSNGESLLVCPQCRLEVKLGTEGINGLPRNTTLANIVLSLEEEKRSKNIICEVCDDEPARAASKNCADCAVTYCNPCFRQLHPMRGAFKYHVIKETSAPITRCISPIFDMRTTRYTPLRDGYGTDGAESGEDSGSYASQDQLEKVRRQIKSKKKELNSVMKTVQNLLKTTEDETEERMREVRSICSQINECVGEKEATMLTTISQQRHEAVKQCLSLSSEVKAQTLSLDLLEDQVNDILSVTAVHSGTDVSNDIASLQDRLSSIQSRSLAMRAKIVPRQPKLGDVEVVKYVASLDFAKDQKLLGPVFTELTPRPVRSGPALVDLHWRPMDDVSKFILSSKIKDAKGFEITSTVELAGSYTSYLMTLPWSSSEYYITLEAFSDEGAKHPIVGRNISTLPYVHCIKVKFQPATSHKRIAVSLAKDEVVHRKCKLSSVHNACPITTGFQRLDKLEGAMSDECLPQLPYVYWECVIHFHVFGKLGNSKLLCDVGICKQGCEDSSALLCDNFKSYCAYLVRRNNKIALEFWNGSTRDVLPRSIPVLDLDQENEKTLKLGFYYDAMRKVFVIISPGNNTILSQFYVKFPNVVPICGLYSFEHVFGMVKFTDPQKLPQVLFKLMK